MPNGLRVKPVLAVGGTWIATTADIANGLWVDITSRAPVARSPPFARPVVDKDRIMALPPPAKRPTLYFVGVSTGQSSIMRVFPAWAAQLGLDAEIKGIDFPLACGPRRLSRRGRIHPRRSVFYGRVGDDA